MADYNRNRRDAYRQQFGWNEDTHPGQQYDEEPNYTISENRGYRDSGGTRGREGGWESRYERDMYTSREGDYDRYQRPYTRYRDTDYGDDTGRRGLSSAYADFGGDYATRSRDLYDRGHQGMGRRDYENRENRLGGGNYDRYGDRGRYGQQENFPYGESRFSRGDTGGYYGRRGGHSDYHYGNRYSGNRGFGSGDTEERSWWDKTTDEVSSWFGDEEAERRREYDRMQNHRGRGPRNYTRSDERITEDINDRLSDDPFIDATDIEVSVSKGEVTLSGHVDHRSSKRRAEDLAESISGVRNVENRIRVQPVTAMHTPSDTTTSRSTSPVPGSSRGANRETGQSK